MLTSKILENRGLEGVRASLGRCWKAPGGSVALPGRSGEVAGGFGEVPGTVLEVQEPAREGGRPSQRPISGPSRGKK